MKFLNFFLFLWVIFAIIDPKTLVLTWFSSVVNPLIFLTNPDSRMILGSEFMGPDPGVNYGSAGSSSTTLLFRIPIAFNGGCGPDRPFVKNILTTVPY
jgi:hypothetical protein